MDTERKKIRTDTKKSLKSVLNSKQDGCPLNKLQIEYNSQVSMFKHKHLPKLYLSCSVSKHFERE